MYKGISVILLGHIDVQMKPAVEHSLHGQRVFGRIAKQFRLMD